jgi:hypothetical protein
LHDVPDGGLDIANVGQHSTAVGKVEAARADGPVHDVVSGDLPARACEIIKESRISVRCNNEALRTSAFGKSPCNGSGTGSNFYATPPSLDSDGVNPSQCRIVVELLKYLQSRALGTTLGIRCHVARPRKARGSGRFHRSGLFFGHQATIRARLGSDA